MPSGAGGGGQVPGPSQVLQDARFDTSDRHYLFRAAVDALAGRLNSSDGFSGGLVVPDLSPQTFATPLMVLNAASLSVRGQTDVPGTRAELLAALVMHEDNHWNGTVSGLDTDATLRRGVGLASRGRLRERGRGSAPAPAGPGRCLR